MFAIEFSMAQTYINTLENDTVKPIWIGKQSIDSGFAHSGNHFSVADSIIPYGLGVEMFFPEEVKAKNTYLKFSAWVKSDIVSPNALYVITVLKDGYQVYWNSINLKPIISDTSKWFMFSDSVQIPGGITKNGKVKAFLWNASGKGRVMIDDLSVKFIPFQSESYLPEIELTKNEVLPESKNYIFSNKWYSVYFDEMSKQLTIFGKDFNPLVKNISSLFEMKTENDTLKLSTNINKLKWKTRKSGAELILFFENDFVQRRLKMNLSSFKPLIEFEVEDKFRRKADVLRSSIIIESGEKATEVYRFNRQLGENPEQKEYWLDKEGLRFGGDKNSLLVYHQTDISSMQLDNQNSALIINLDWAKDHPFFRFPLAPDSTNWKYEQSFSSFEKREKNHHHFSFYAGINFDAIPRFMKNPAGFLSTYIWTEHADFTNIRTNRAAYFGSEKITSADSAVGGFVKYNIPVTKSVFYANPDSITNSNASHGLFTGLESSITSDSALFDFLKQINEKGSEICLHTPEQYTTTRSFLDEALGFMNVNFASPSWIDHGNNNKLHNNREDLICDATLKDSPWYAIDLWEKNGVKYLHNAYYEEYFTFLNKGFNSSIEKAYTGWGDYIPKPDYWQHKASGKNLWHWPTESALFVENENLWSYYFEKAKFLDFISNWSVEINHVYPAWVDPKKGFWKFDADSTIIAQNGFNKTLEIMDGFRKSGEINLTTIEDFMNYRLAIDSIKYDLLNDGRIRITNQSNKDLKNLGMAAKAKIVLVDRTKPFSKQVGEDLIFWFDLKSGESKIIRLVK